MFHKFVNRRFQPRDVLRFRLKKLCPYVSEPAESSAKQLSYGSVGSQASDGLTRSHTGAYGNGSLQATPAEECLASYQCLYEGYSKEVSYRALCFSTLLRDFSSRRIWRERLTWESRSHRDCHGLAVLREEGKVGSEPCSRAVLSGLSLIGQSMFQASKAVYAKST